MQDDDAVGRAAQSEVAGAAAGIPASTRPSRANAGPVILPPETLALMEDASTTVPFTVVAIFDSALSATVTYVSPNTKYQPLVFSYNAVTYTSANALARAMIADWRVAHDTVAGWPTGLARSACNNFSFLLVRCGRELLSLRYAKEFHLLCVGGSFVGSQRAQLSPQAVARLAPLQVPFTVHLRGEPRLTAACEMVTARRHGVRPSQVRDAAGETNCWLQYAFRVPGSARLVDVTELTYQFLHGRMPPIVSATEVRIKAEPEDEHGAPPSWITGPAATDDEDDVPYSRLLVPSGDRMEGQCHVRVPSNFFLTNAFRRHLVVTTLGITLHEARKRGAFDHLTDALVSLVVEGDAADRSDAL
jgi:hypothetical protein